jgi:hypothetical protein
MSGPRQFANVIAALAFVRAWRDAGHPIDQHPTAPPCDELEDEVYDVMLGHVFRDLARLDTATERVCRLQEAIDVNLPMIEFCRARREDAAAARVERMVEVLRKWTDEITSASIEGRAA